MLILKEKSHFLQALYLRCPYYAMVCLSESLRKNPNLPLVKEVLAFRSVSSRHAYTVAQRFRQPRTLELYKFLGVLPELLSHEECSRLLVLEHWTSPQGQEPVATKQIMDEDTTPDRPCVSWIFLLENVLK